MLSCVFLGHTVFNYLRFRAKTEMVIEDLIKLGVTKFYNYYRGNFDIMCAHLVNNLRDIYPHLKHIMVLPYLPTSDFVLPSYFDDCICLSNVREENAVSINYANSKLVENVDFIVSGVANEYDETKVACDYAEIMHKRIIYVVKNNDDNIIT